MKPEESVEVDDLLARNSDARTHRVIRGLGVRNNNVETIGRAPLEDDNQPLIGYCLGCAKCGPREELRNRRRPNHRHGSAL